jgi:hypothetical protein
MLFVGEACLLGCGGSQSAAADASGAAGATKRDNRIQHEVCDVKSSDARHTDVNGDGRPDITLVPDGKSACKAVDLNFDGLVDAYVYTDDAGNVRRRESDYDRDGRIDEISEYKGGALTVKVRATTQGGKLDTWHFYEQGKLVRTERDSDLDSVVDQWWEYPRPGQYNCPLIHSDVDGDGRPDPGATVDVCGEDSGYVPPERDTPAENKNTFERAEGEGLPSELDNRPAGSEEAPEEGLGDDTSGESEESE